MAKKKKFSKFRNKPFVRSGNELYYGSMEDPFVIRLQVKTTKEVNGLQVADKVAIQLLATDPNLSPRKQIVKTSEKRGLYLSMDIADIWLERALDNRIKV